MKNKYIFYKYQYLNNIISLFFFFLSYYFYYISLEKCFSGIDVCGRKLKWIINKVCEIFVSSFISSLLFLFILTNKISKLHILHFILHIFILYLYSHGYSFEDHGLLNLIGYASLFIIFIIIDFIIKRFIEYIFINNSPYKNTKFLTILIIILLYYDLISPLDCKDWGKGLNNTFIENDINKFGCKIKYPKLCPYKIFNHFMDLTKLFSVNCSISNKNTKNIILDKSKSHYINKHTTKFGFPLTNKDLIGKLDGKDDLILTKYVLDNLFDVENNSNVNNNYELVLDFSKSNSGEYIINIKYNESLGRERKKLETKNSPYSNNIMIIFIDSVSRANSIRQMKKTLSFFENFIRYNGGYHPNYPNEIFHSFQFFKYHSFKYHISGNFPRIFYGNDISKTNSNFVLFTRYFKENGYITNYNSDSCQKDNTRTFHNLTDSEVYDHQFLLCDPSTPVFYSTLKKCLHSKTNAEHLFNYSNQFWRSYRDNRKLSVIILNDGHEGTLEALKYTDIIIFNYLNSLFQDNLLKDSSVILLSDHGVVMPSIYSIYDFYIKEMKLPMLYLLINDRKNISYNEQYLYLYKNQQTFITAYDIYNTINHLLYGDSYVKIENKTSFNDTPKSSLGQSLFYNIDQKARASINYKSMDYSVCI